MDKTKKAIKLMLQQEIRMLYDDRISYSRYIKFRRKLNRELEDYKKIAVGYPNGKKPNSKKINECI